jgi:cellobiose phosphorylase
VSCFPCWTPSITPAHVSAFTAIRLNRTLLRRRICRARTCRARWMDLVHRIGWMGMYRAGLDWILGFRLRGATLLIDPYIPRAWRRFEIVFRYHSARYDIAVENPHEVSRGVTRVELDGKLLQGNPVLILFVR